MALALGPESMATCACTHWRVPGSAGAVRVLVSTCARRRAAAVRQAAGQHVARPRW